MSWLHTKYITNRQLNTENKDSYLVVSSNFSDLYVLLFSFAEKNYTLSRYHFIHCDDGEGCAAMLVEYHITAGFPSEVDLFVAQAVLQWVKRVYFNSDKGSDFVWCKILLCQSPVICFSISLTFQFVLTLCLKFSAFSKYRVLTCDFIFRYLCLRNKNTAEMCFTCFTKHHPQIEDGPPFVRPLLNFLWLLLLAVEGWVLKNVAGALKLFNCLPKIRQPADRHDKSYPTIVTT